MAPVIIATDKTQLTQYSGNKAAYPVYMTLGNLPRSLRRKPSKHACILIAYLSVSKSVGKKLTKKQKSSRIQQIFHDSMHVVLEPLMEAGKKGVEVTFGDGCVRRVHPILACYVADYPEQCLVTCAKYGTCPKCLASEDELGLPQGGKRRTQRETLGVIKENIPISTSLNNFQERCKARKVSGAVTRPFWEGFPCSDIHMSITPDILHQLYQGVIKHLINWCTSLMSEKELDDRLLSLPPCFGVRHFKKGWSELAQVSGGERKDMARIMLGCLIGKVPSKVIICYRAILDFVYIAQYPSHDDDTLQYLTDALALYHANKHILTSPELAIREHLNIPKFHAMTHYVQAIRDFGTTDNYNTEMFERFHIDCAKEAWRASNFRDEFPQMVRWLARQEKAALFESYLQHYDTGEDSDHQEDGEAEIDGVRDDSGDTASKEVIISQRPKAFNQPLHSIQIKHHCPSFSHHLRIYLNNFLERDKRIPRNQLPLTILPFHKVNVWHAFKFPRDSLGNDVDEKEELDAVKAQPGRGSDVQARFDTVVVPDTDEAENTGLKGESFFWLAYLITCNYLCV